MPDGVARLDRIIAAHDRLIAALERGQMPEYAQDFEAHVARLTGTTPETVRTDLAGAIANLGASRRVAVAARRALLR